MWNVYFILGSVYSFFVLFVWREVSYQLDTIRLSYSSICHTLPLATTPPPPRPPSFSVALSPSFSPVLFFALFSANSRHSVLNGNRGFFRLVLNRLAWLLSARSIFAENLYIALYCVCGADVDSIQIK